MGVNRYIKGVYANFDKYVASTNICGKTKTNLFIKKLTQI